MQSLLYDYLLSQHKGTLESTPQYLVNANDNTYYNKEEECSSYLHIICKEYLSSENLKDI